MADSDRRCLERWIRDRDADAFKDVASTYMGMVYAACLRITRNPGEAEAATQACFEELALVTAVPRTMLGAWLHRAATNQSLERAGTRPRKVAGEPRPTHAQGDGRGIQWKDVEGLVDEAIAGLPGKVRGPVVAHFLEDRSCTAISATLGVSRQAVADRVEKGAGLIRNALRKRGVPVPASALAAMMTAQLPVAAPTPAAVSAALDRVASRHEASGGTAATGMDAEGANTFGGIAVAKSTALGMVIGAAAALLIAGAAFTIHTRDAENESGRAEIVDTAKDAGVALRAGPDEALETAVASLTADLARAKQRIAELEDALAEATASLLQASQAGGGKPPAKDPPQTKPLGRDTKAGPKDYGALFEEWDLAPETEATARELLNDAMAQRKAEKERALKSGDLPAREVARRSGEITAQLRADLSGLLPGNALASWEDYEAHRDWFEGVRTFDAKLAAISPGLTEENRLIASEVIVEERLLVQDAFYQSEAPYTRQAQSGLEVEASQYARERLAQFLPEDQYAEVDRLLTLVELHAKNAQQDKKSPVDKAP